MAGVSLNGQVYTLGFLVPFEVVGPDLFDMAELEVWFKDNIQGPKFPRNPMVDGRYRHPNGWWDIDKKVQKAWRDKAVKELHGIIGHIID